MGVLPAGMLVTLTAGMLVMVLRAAALPTSCAGTSFMPHLGQRSGWSLLTSGCIGQAYAVGGASVASSFMPHFVKDGVADGAGREAVGDEPIAKSWTTTRSTADRRRLPSCGRALVVSASS